MRKTARLITVHNQGSIPLSIQDSGFQAMQGYGPENTKVPGNHLPESSSPSTLLFSPDGTGKATPVYHMA